MDPNHSILHTAEIVYGSQLEKDSNLSHLICQPCKRRLNNFSQFKSVVTVNQRLLRGQGRSKRCAELLPFITKPSTKVRASDSFRRSISFDEDQAPCVSSPYVSI